MISATEGVLRHMLALYSQSLRNVPNYPKEGKKNKRIEKFSLDDCIDAATQLHKLVPNIELIPSGFAPVFERLREIRNYVHPHIEVRDAERSPISESHMNPGVAQLALGALNIVLAHLAGRRFIGKHVWRVAAGTPDYSEATGQLRLPLAVPYLHSCLLLSAFTKKDFTLDCDVTIPNGHVLNFMYNVSDSGFLAIRIDKRDNAADGYPDDGVLEVDFGPPLRWRKRCFFTTTGQIPSTSTLSHSISIVATGSSLVFSVDKQTLEPVVKAKDKSLWGFDRTKQIGFFNEEGEVVIERLTVK